MTPRAATAALWISGTTWVTIGRSLVPGLLASGVLAAASAFQSQHYGAPVMLLALLLGMAMKFLSAEGACVPGIEFTAQTVLRIGVALLGPAHHAAPDRIARLAWSHWSCSRSR